MSNARSAPPTIIAPSALGGLPEQRAQGGNNSQAVRHVYVHNPYQPITIGSDSPHPPPSVSSRGGQSDVSSSNSSPVPSPSHHYPRHVSPFQEPRRQVPQPLHQATAVTQQSYYPAEPNIFSSSPVHQNPQPGDHAQAQWQYAQCDQSLAMQHVPHQPYQFPTHCARDFAELQPQSNAHRISSDPNILSQSQESPLDQRTYQGEIVPFRGNIAPFEDHHHHQQQHHHQGYKRYTFPTNTEFTWKPPHGTLHTELSGRMNFVLYPHVATEHFEAIAPKRQLVRIFVGQLPYNVTEMQLAWILYTFGAGANMYHFERITKTDHSKGGIKVPTGCFHCHLEAEQVGPLLKFLNDRLLVDDTGIWVTDTAEERSLLARYCHGMKLDKSRRFQGRPYGTVVAQVATSTFDPDTFVPARAQGGTHRSP